MTDRSTGSALATSDAQSTATARRGHTAARGLVWLHLLLAWTAVWVLYSTLIAAAHDESVSTSALSGARAIAAAAALGLLVQRLTERLPWPRPLSARFLLVHLAAAVGFGLTWVGLTSALEALVGRPWVLSRPTLFIPFVILGIWLYLMVAGITYAVRGTERAARAEAAAALTQLAALRAQLNPHFLFNALHTVVQLIPVEPTRAALAAEQVAGLLRTVIEEDRDLVPLDDERRFVERYLAVEHLRFGDRLETAFEVEPALSAALVPSFALQTLVENAVRHGAAPRVDATTITVSARADGARLLLTVTDSGAGSTIPLHREATTVKPATVPGGSGLRRLAERLEVLYGRRATLSLVSEPGRGFVATVAIPLQHAD